MAIQSTSNSIFTGPGLAIRVVCAEQPYLCQDFEETSEIVKRIVNFSQASKTASILVLFSRPTCCPQTYVCPDERKWPCKC